MGAGASSSTDALPTSTPPAEATYNRRTNGGGETRRSSGGDRNITFSASWNEKRQRAKQLRQHEAAVMKFIKKNVSSPLLTTPLINIIGESRPCKDFKRYIGDGFKQDLLQKEKTMSEKDAAMTKELAFHYLVFWLDVSDFCLFAAGSFRNFRAEKMWERYLYHGAKCNLPFSRLMVDEIVTRRDAEASAPVDLFQPAQVEAFEFLESEVLPFYLKSECPNGYETAQRVNTVVHRLKHSTKEMMYTEDSVKGSIASERSSEDSSKREALISKLTDILREPFATRAFKDYLVTLNSAELLLFYLECSDFKEMFTAVLATEARHVNVMSQIETEEKEGGDSPVAAAPAAKPTRPPTPDRQELISRNFHYFLTRAHKIYDKYLKLGCNLRDIFSHRDLETIVSCISSAYTLNPYLFDDLKEKAYEHMLYDHCSKFTRSLAYIELQSFLQQQDERRKRSMEYVKNRKRILSVAKAVTVINKLGGPGTMTKRSCKSVVAEDVSDGRPKSPSAGLDNDLDVDILLEEERRELKALLTSNTTGRFQQYLMEQKDGHKLMLWQEIESYKEVPRTQTTYLQSRAQKIFDKYIKRGAPMEVGLEQSVRNNLVTMIDKASLSLFDEVEKAVFKQLLLEWPLFRQSDYYEEKPREHDRRSRDSIDQFNRTVTISSPDITFVEILSFPIMITSFKKFVEGEFCIEPLMFWLDVQEYKRLPRSEYMRNRCRKIINRYIRTGAPMAITISAEARAQAMERMENTGPLVFQMAENDIYTFMEVWLLPKYRKSAEFQDLLKTISLTGKNGLVEDIKHTHLDLDITPETDATANGPITLKALLSSQTGVKFFKEFLRTRLCEENLLFWLECEDYKETPGKDFMKIRARKICKKYIVEDAKQQVNIPHSIRVELLKNLILPNRSLFQKAQDEVLLLIKKDSFPPFLLSEQFKAYQELIQASDQTNWRKILRCSIFLSLGGSDKIEKDRANAYTASQQG